MIVFLLLSNESVATALPAAMDGRNKHAESHAIAIYASLLTSETFAFASEVHGVKLYHCYYRVTSQRDFGYHTTRPATRSCKMHYFRLHQEDDDNLSFLP